MEANKRIDSGIKRGPKRRPIRSGLPTNPTDPADLGTWHIPPDLNPDSVLERYLSESSTSQIAKQYGLSRKALTKWLRQVRPSEWKQAQVLRALCIKEDSEDGLASAADPLSLARAREMLKGAQFDLVSLDDDYRPKTDVTLHVSGDLGDRLRRARERVIDVEVIPEKSLTIKE